MQKGMGVATISAICVYPNPNTTTPHVHLHPPNKHNYNPIYSSIIYRLHLPNFNNYFSSFFNFRVISGNYHWTFLEWMSSCFHDSSSKWASWIIYIYLFGLSPVANAHDNALLSGKYACEDVQSYYAGTNHLGGEALSRKLNSIISGHHSLSYKEVWDALKILDAAKVHEPEASSSIVEIYSARIVPKSLAGKPEGWNREHLWPRSYGLTPRPSLTDLHNIRPADVNVNSSRGNKYFGECHVGSTHCRKPASKEAASDTETDMMIWAPPRRVCLPESFEWGARTLDGLCSLVSVTEVRGDVARALMYMAVRYGFHQRGEGPVLHLSDNPSMMKREMGLLSILLKWNEMDPPSRDESLRNERICRLYQHNRNPFVDHPEYANLIWKVALSRYQNLHMP